jgi:hypothetical protein
MVMGGFERRSNDTVGLFVGDRDPALPVVVTSAVPHETNLGETASELEGQAPTSHFDLHGGHDGEDEGSGLASAAYSTFLGPGVAYAIAVDGCGNAYVVGETPFSSFPTTAGAFDTTINGSSDVFVTKLAADGSSLVYSTYIGGNHADGGSHTNHQGMGIAVDASGAAYITGRTTSTDFPVTPGAFDSSLAIQADAFVVKLNADGSNLVYATYLGGLGDQHGLGIAVDGSGNAYVGGVSVGCLRHVHQQPGVVGNPRPPTPVT